MRIVQAMRAGLLLRGYGAVSVSSCGEIRVLRLRERMEHPGFLELVGGGPELHDRELRVALLPVARKCRRGPHGGSHAGLPRCPPRRARRIRSSGSLFAAVPSRTGGGHAGLRELAARRVYRHRPRRFAKPVSARPYRRLRTDLLQLRAD